jgi:3'-phosphoadenosine 5'-phosphosulfate sulfotransferase (PAPS reductase)/FAD synthetase
MKKGPMHIYERANKLKPVLATMASESRIRKQAWLRTGCNAFEAKSPKSTPMAFWTEDDVLRYAQRENVDLCSVYGEITCDEQHCHCTGAQRTGCMFCGFGAHAKTDNRFVRLSQTHPKLYDYCMGGGQWIDNPDYIEGLSTKPDSMGWIAWNPKKIWVPSANGLGMRYVIDCVNAIYGAGTIKY